MIPRVAHFVFGLQEQSEPMHFMHYASIESCRRVLEPERIYLHHGRLPWGPWWERIAPHVTLAPVAPVAEVLAADYGAGLVPESMRYAHHADFLRLDALIEHGGVYADIDTIFVRAFPQKLFEERFVIGREPAVRDERSGAPRASLCNALLVSEPASAFARAWRERMAAALDGSWSNHSGFLSQELSELMPGQVRVEPQRTFFAFSASVAGLAALLRERHEVPEDALSVHLWAHLWWERRRRDFSPAHAAWAEPSFVRSARSTLAELLRPYLPERRSERDAAGSGAPRQPAEPAEPRQPGDPDGRGGPRWSYLSTDDVSGYGVAADRAMAALRGAGIEIDWLPYVPEDGNALYYGRGLSAAAAPLPAGAAEGRPPVVVAHLVPEYFPEVRREHREAFLVGHTVWETDRLPRHWPALLDAVDLLVVPCGFNARVIEAAGVRTPVAVVPHVAPAPLPAGPARPAQWAGIPADTLVFYTIAMWTERKAVFRTVEAFLRAFTAREKVMLIIKSSYRDYTLPLAEGGGLARRGSTGFSLARLLAEHPDPPPVKLITRDLSDAELTELHARGDCFVSLCHGEGWGLGSFDAAAHGRPVVTTGFGGQLDYLAGWPWLVDYELVPVRERAGAASYSSDQRWAEPDVEHGAALLRQIAADPRGAGELARQRAEEIRVRYSPDAVARAFIEAVERALTRARSSEGQDARA